MRRWLAIAVMLSGRCLAAETDASELVEFSLEHLMTMDIEVTTTAKREQNVLDSSSAVFVVTSEDILRSGVNTIPDALRMVPGVQVGQIDNNEWSVAIRGQGGRFSRYLQVLVDGRSVYDPVFSNVNWDELNLTLEDIDRIEVIRGPGSSVWGANAVNGVINIVTKTPAAKDESQITVGGGDYTRAHASLQSSHQVNETTEFRVSGNYFRREGLESTRYEVQEGDAYGERVSFAGAHRVGSNEWLLNADLYQLHNDTIWLDTSPYGVASSNGTAHYEADEDKQGYAVQLRYSHQFNDTDALKIRTSVDDMERESEVFTWNTGNIDFDVEYIAEFGANYLTLGSNNRYTNSEVRSGVRNQVQLVPEEDSATVNSIFIHDTLTITDRWKTDVGVRYERHSEAGDNVQGTLRMMWLPNSDQRLWAAVSKADGTPSRLTTSSSRATFAVIPGVPNANPLLSIPPTLVTAISDGSSLDNSTLMAYEIGYRLTISKSFSVDLAAYYNDYEHLIEAQLTSLPAAPVFEPISGNPYLPVDIRLGDGKDVDSSGVEVAVNWRLNQSWYLQYSGSYINFKDEVLFGGSLANALPSYNVGVDVPSHQHSIRLMGDLSRQWSVSLWLRYVDEQKLAQIDSYTVLDTRLSYKPSDRVTLSLIAKNLGEKAHIESAREAYYFDTFEVERSVYADIRWNF